MVIELENEIFIHFHLHIFFLDVEKPIKRIILNGYNYYLLLSGVKNKRRFTEKGMYTAYSQLFHCALQISYIHCL